MREVAQYGSIAEAARETDADASSISACCRGKLKTVKGYKWEYIEKKG